MCNQIRTCIIAHKNISRNTVARKFTHRTFVTLSWAFTCLHFLALFARTEGTTSTSIATKEAAVAPPLILQDVNLIVVTDVHSWIAGHKHNTSLTADYGDVISFYEHLQARARDEEKDLFFLMNGDFMDGTGFSKNPPVDLTSILQEMPWDALNIGNHELYQNSTIDHMIKEGGFVQSGLITNFQDRQAYS